MQYGVFGILRKISDPLHGFAICWLDSAFACPTDLSLSLSLSVEMQ
jgi:hypothetical protein